MTSNIFEEINKKVKENNTRWEKLNTLAEEITLYLKTKNIGDHDIINKLSETIVLLIEQLRPLHSSAKEVETLQQDITDMIGSLSKFTGK